MLLNQLFFRGPVGPGILFKFFPAQQGFIIKMSKSGQWFYAVKKGRNPGVYYSWPECQKQVIGFSGPIFKKFASFEAALSFTAYDAPPCSTPVTNTLPSTSSAPVSNGNEKGSEQSLQQQLLLLKSDIQGIRSEMKELSSTVTQLNSAVFQVPGSKRGFHSSASARKDMSNVEKQSKVPKFDNDKEHVTGEPFHDSSGVHVYTDGGCFDNGRNGARAGIGVFWGKDDPDNVSERLPGRPTNNRAEIHAAVKAVQIAKRRGIDNLILHTDSQFLINGITKWIKGWKKNGWVLSTGKPVINREDFEELDEALKGINVKWKYVRGHSGNLFNEAVDRLAKQGANQGL